MTVYNNLSLPWFRDHFINEILPFWLKSAPTSNGFFYPNLSRDWTRYGEPVGTLVSQARLLYVFSNGYNLTHDPEILQVINSGVTFLLENFYDEEYSGFVWSCDQNGEKLDFTKDAYGHVFVILGLVNSYKATRENFLLEKAIETLDLLHSNFTDNHGGLIWKMSRDWIDNDGTRSQNPMMHTFESMLALLPHINDPTKKAALKRSMMDIVQFLFPNASTDNSLTLPEIYNKSWEPVQTQKGGYISVGHLFEWAFLLSASVRSGLPDSFLVIANKLLKTGLLLGYENEKGYIKTWIDEHGNVLWDEISWWEQSEALRTLLRFIIQLNRRDLIQYFLDIFNFVKDRFIDNEYGGWYTSLNPDATPRNINKGSTWKLDYHQTGLCVEANNYLK